MYLMSESLLVTAKIPGHCGKNQCLTLSQREGQNWLMSRDSK